jgi:glutaryl-CoA dehydrogenase
MRTTQTQPIARSATDSPRARDFLKVDAHLSEEKDIREKIRSFVEERIEPSIKDRCERAQFPRELVPDMGSLGVLGTHLKGYGCAGKGAVSYGPAFMELEAGDSDLRTLVSVQGSLVMSALHKFGSEEQRRGGCLQ